jgi:hypothetical protein
MAQQTAVEWLIEEIKNFDSGRSQYYSKIAIYNHAYRMGKEQIIDAASRSCQSMCYNDRISAEQYYNETYNK